VRGRHTYTESCRHRHMQTEMPKYKHTQETQTLREPHSESDTNTPRLMGTEP
jgi:hypothetical protein